MRWPWSREKSPSVHVDADTFAILKRWSDERGVPIDALVRDVLRAVLPSRLHTGPVEPGKATLDEAFAALDGEDREVGLPTPEIAPPGEGPCLNLHPDIPAMFRPGECSGTCHHHSQKGRPCFWSGASARLCSLYQPSKKRA